MTKTFRLLKNYKSPRFIVVTLGLLFFYSDLFALTVEPEAPIIVTPKLEDKLSPITISSVEVQARVLGFVAETTITLTLSNSNARQLEGNVYFPLPQGATVSGYALDVKGKMVDGVAIEKHKARIVFEKEVRKGIDPGLVEVTKGNHFHTRIYPIPANGSRRLKITYVSELLLQEDVAHYQLPLSYTGIIQEFSLHIDIIKPETTPTVSWSGAKQLVFAKTQQGLFTEVQLRKQKLSGMLEIKLPGISKQQVLVEKSGEQYFFALLNKATQFDNKAIKPRYIGLIWDASGSRGQVNHDKELALLKRYFTSLAQEKITINLQILRHQMKLQGEYIIHNGDASKLIQTLKNIQYDGGTQIAAIDSRKFNKQPDLILLFSDGLSTYAKEITPPSSKPIFSFSTGITNNFDLLNWISNQSGGQYFNLNKAKIDTAISFLNSSANKTSIDYNKAELKDVLISKQADRLLIIGKIQQPRGKLKLNINGIQSNFTIDTSNAVNVNSGLLARLWAQNKVRELAVFPKTNHKKIIRLAQKYNLVTPLTSLLVLETLSQYVQHQIRPPESLTDFVKQYVELAEKAQQKKQVQKEDKLVEMAALWEKRVKWWNKKFTYVKKKPKPQKSTISALMSAPVASMEESEPIFGIAPSVQQAPMRRESRAKRKAGRQDRRGTGSTIDIKPWSPSTPYLTALKSAKQDHFSVYMQQKTNYGSSPGFYLDCADFFSQLGEKLLALQVLSNIAELGISDPALLRILAHRLVQLGHADTAIIIFEEVLSLRPEEPQSYRDLALILAQQQKYTRAMDLLAHVVMNRWDRFQEIELIALMELNRIIPKARAAGITEIPLDKRLIKLLDLDLRFVLTWDTDLTDVDLWIIEPTGEKAYYGYNLTGIGGLVSRDFTQGYGPEEYLLHHSPEGEYKIQVNFYGSRAQKLTGAVTLQLDIYTNYGRENENKKSTTVRLTNKKEVLTIGTVKF